MKTEVPGFWRCLAREWAELRRLPEQCALFWIPLAALVLTWAIFARGVALDLPVAVVDEDGSAASRQFIRWLDATPGVQAGTRLASLDAAWAALRRGDVYGVVLVPRDFARDLKRGRSGELVAWYNAQFLPIANVISREVQSAAAGFGATLEAHARLARGETRTLATVQLNPIAAQRTTLFNPQLNYGPFLVTGIAAAVLHMAAMLAAVRGVGRELRAGTAPAWLASAGGGRLAALAGKLALPFAVHVVLGFGMLIAWHGVLGWPLRGSGLLLVAGLVALLAAYYALGAAVVLVTANYRLASSVAAFLTAPALAFGGVTFPLEAMPWPAWSWGRLLPLTSFLQLQIEQTTRGAPAAASVPPLLALLAFAAVGAGVALALVRRRATQPSAWDHR
jgi:ABC-2 type transport system permease protein